MKGDRTRRVGVQGTWYGVFVETQVGTGERRGAEYVGQEIRWAWRKAGRKTRSSIVVWYGVVAVVGYGTIEDVVDAIHEVGKHIEEGNKTVDRQTAQQFPRNVQDKEKMHVPVPGGAACVTGPTPAPTGSLGARYRFLSLSRLERVECPASLVGTAVD